MDATFSPEPLTADSRCPSNRLAAVAAVPMCPRHASIASIASMKNALRLAKSIWSKTIP